MFPDHPGPLVNPDRTRSDLRQRTRRGQLDQRRGPRPQVVPQTVRGADRRAAPHPQLRQPSPTSCRPRRRSAAGTGRVSRRSASAIMPARPRISDRHRPRLCRVGPVRTRLADRRTGPRTRRSASTATASRRRAASRAARLRAAVAGGGLRGGLGHVCILARHEPASTGATSRDGRGRGNRLGAAGAARSGTLTPRGGRPRGSRSKGGAGPSSGGCCQGHLKAPLSPTQVLGFLAEPMRHRATGIMARHVAVTLR